MDKNFEIVGYVDLPVIMETRCGELIKLHAEAYIVLNMTVDVLLREDFQQTYKIGVRQIPEVRATITFENEPHIVHVAPIDGLKQKPVECSMLSTKKFAQAVSHRRQKKCAATSASVQGQGCRAGSGGGKCPD
jgi:hypothetical protein